MFHVVVHLQQASLGWIAAWRASKTAMGMSKTSSGAASEVAPSYFCHILLAKSESKGEPRFKVGVEQMNKLHHLTGVAAQSHCKGHGFGEAIWDTRTIDLLQGDRQANPELEHNVKRTVFSLFKGTTRRIKM